ncbi:cysteine-rich protein 2-binding protein-like isoform X2 [Ornithodoros turicata]|uniref:cysteine-rich protein 2-binding protein-like isoform X2 n=1 Tax=Ornithodoros turicata TaxID=34597 RepID=UPI00313A123E
MDGLHCYCNTNEVNSHMLQCCVCKKYFHAECLKFPPQTTLVGDLFYKLTCERCSPEQTETCERIKMQWVQVIMLALYNLHVSGASGKLGYFRWREHICTFIDKYWTAFFGDTRKKTATFRGTVAGALSSGCPQYFRSGTVELKEAGWWTLTEMKPPSPLDFDGVNPLTAKYRKPKAGSAGKNLPLVEGTRRRNVTSAIQAAMHLKEKKSGSQNVTQASALHEVVIKKEPDSNDETHPALLQIQDSVMTTDDFSWSSSTLEQDMLANDSFRQQLIGSNESLNDASIFQEEAAAQQGLCLKMKVEEEEEMLDMEEFNVEESICDPSYLRVESPNVDDLVSDILTTDVGATEEVSWGGTSGRSTPQADSGIIVKEEPQSGSESYCSSTETSRGPALSKKRRMDEKQIQGGSAAHIEVPEKPRCAPMSMYEEHQLLRQLEKYGQKMKLPPEAQRLRRKLLVRQMKRARNTPVFDLDQEVCKLTSGMLEEVGKMKGAYLQPHKGGVNVLDRYQVTTGTARLGIYTRTSFITRILGLEEEQLECTISPYTQRTLKPFILRDYETMPLRLRLLEEIVTQKRNSGQSAKPTRHPIDYCYVRPQHIPVVNAMCETFFWPGIDLSESLEYPDFSCVVMYRRQVQRGLHSLYIHSSRMAASWNCKVYDLSPHTDVHRQRRNAACVGNKPCRAPVPEVWLQS